MTSEIDGMTLIVHAWNGRDCSMQVRRMANTDDMVDDLLYVDLGIPDVEAAVFSAWVGDDDERELFRRGKLEIGSNREVTIPILCGANSIVLVDAGPEDMEEMDLTRLHVRGASRMLDVANEFIKKIEPCARDVAKSAVDGSKTIDEDAIVAALPLRLQAVYDVIRSSCAEELMPDVPVQISNYKISKRVRGVDPKTIGLMTDELHELGLVTKRKNGRRVAAEYVIPQGANARREKTGEAERT